MPNSGNITKYKQYKSTLNRLLRKAEREYYHSQLALNKRNLKRQWTILKDIVNKKKGKVTPHQFKFGEEVVSNNAIISGRFNSFFTNIGNELSKKVANTDINPTSYVKCNARNSMFISFVYEKEIESVHKKTERC